MRSSHLSLGAPVISCGEIFEAYRHKYISAETEKFRCFICMREFQKNLNFISDREKPFLQFKGAIMLLKIYA
jgi:hypothetical protein